MPAPLRAVLFDLDGTLLDTAPDLVGALNALRAEEGLAPTPYAQVRAAVSHGSKRVLEVAFPNAAKETIVAFQKRFLDLYRGALCRETRYFPGMQQVLAVLEEWGLKSGIVTNKPAWLTDPLLDELGVREHFACVVSGDSVARCKPHPLPLLHAATLAGVSVEQCIYVGDAQRDVQAAHAARMPALVANYGYLELAEDSARWGAEGYLEKPADLLDWLGASGRL